MQPKKKNWGRLIRGLVAVAALWFCFGGMLPAYRRSITIEEGRYTVFALSRASRWIVANHPEKLPESLPGNFGIISSPFRGIEESQEIVNADPFDSDCTEPRKVTVEWGRYDFKYSGCPFKYIRVDDRHAVLYSLGPDRDDDLGSRWAVVMVPGSNLREFCLQSQYEFLNGLYSDGDLIYLIDLDHPDEEHAVVWPDPITNKPAGS